jgi:hypothetical protein
MHAPLNFPDSPEGKRLLRAREEFWRVNEQIKKYTEEVRAKKKGIIVYAAYADENHVKASRECKSALRAYYMVTGDASPLRYTPIAWGRCYAVQKSVEKHFGKIAQDLNSKLVVILPWIYGFATECAVVILEVVDVDRGVPVFFVTLRRREPGEKIDFSNEFGHEDKCGVLLTCIIGFQNRDYWENRWKPNSKDDLSDEALKNHAELLLKYGKSYLTDPNADWAGLQEWLQQENEKRLAERPWLKIFSRS